jgi:hypothetical protein
MKQMALISKFFVCCGIVLLAILIVLAYSIKNREEENSKKTSMVSVKDDEINRLRQENDELKIALAEAKLQNSKLKASLNNITKETQELEQPLKETKIKDEKTGSPNAKLNEKNPIKDIHDQNLVKSILAQFRSSTNADEKVKLLELLGEMALEQDPEVIKIVEDALDDPDPEMGSAAIQLLEDYDTPEILPAIEKALKAKHKETRMAALEQLSNIDDPMVGDLLSQSLNDTSEDVRTAALDMIEERPDSEQLPALQNGLASPYEDVKTQVVQKLEDRSDHKAVEILIEGLQDTNPDFRDKVNTSLSSLIDKEFKSYQEAKDWWDQNKNKYDAELSEIEEGKEK